MSAESEARKAIMKDYPPRSETRFAPIWELNDAQIENMQIGELEYILREHLNRFVLHDDTYRELVKAVRKDLLYMRG